MRSGLMGLINLCLLVCACGHPPGAGGARAPAPGPSSGASSWTYPELVNTWASSGARECEHGTVQSPIDLSCAACLSPQRTKVVVEVPTLEFVPVLSPEDPHNFSFHLPAAMDPRSITVDGSKWQVKEFHFHVPAENRIASPPGRPSTTAPPMEMHIKTQLSTDSHTYAVFAVLFVEQSEPPDRPDQLGAWFDPILRLLGGREPGVFTLGDPTPPISPASGPLAYFESNPFWRFPGSLTTPPCTAVSNWFVLTIPFPIAIGQAAQFSDFLARKFHTARNARGLQPIGARPIMQYVPQQASASTGSGAGPN